MSVWLSELDAALLDAVNQVADRLGATWEDIAETVVCAVVDQPEALPPGVGVRILLDRAELMVATILYETYWQQDEGQPVTTLADIGRMRLAATQFAEQAAHLVQPRLGALAWPMRARHVQ